MKNNRVQLKDKDFLEVENTFEYEERISQLKEFINKNQKEIRNVDTNTTEEEIRKIDKHFDANLKELEVLEEMFQKTEDFHSKETIMELEAMYREVQHNYLTAQMKRVSFGMEEITKSIRKLNEEMDISFSNVRKKTNEITGNILFSVIAIVLGISLVSSMITGITKLELPYLFVYFVTILWLSITVMGMAYLLLREYDKKSQTILMVIILATVLLGCIFYFTFR